MPDPGLPGAIVLICAMVMAAVAVFWLDRRRRGPNAKSTPLHGMAKDDSVSYFRDPTATSTPPGVQEEDSPGRWGEGS